MSPQERALRETLADSRNHVIVLSVDTAKALLADLDRLRASPPAPAPASVEDLL